MFDKKNGWYRFYLTLTLVVAVALAAPALAGNLDPPGPPGPTMKTLDEVEPRVPITALPVTITQSGSYYIIGDLTAPAGDGITVNADNVTIDLMGYSLIGSGPGSGILMSGRKNVEVRNGTIRVFNFGIHESSAVNGQGHRIINVRAEANFSSGILLEGGSHLVKDCTAVGNGNYGIWVGGDSTVAGSTSVGNASTNILAGGGATVVGNSASNNLTGHGISVGDGSTVIGNTAKQNGANGIFTGAGATIKNNTTRSNNGYGINPGLRSLLDGNTATDNNQSGLGATDINTCLSCVFGNNSCPLGSC